MRHSFLALTTILLCASCASGVSSAHAETRIKIKDFPNNGLMLSEKTWADAFISSFSVAENMTTGLNNEDQVSHFILSLNNNLALSGNVINGQDRLEKQQNTEMSLTFVVKSSF